jgi:hypothetical protein
MRKAVRSISAKNIQLPMLSLLPFESPHLPQPDLASRAQSCSQPPQSVPFPHKKPLSSACMRRCDDSKECAMPQEAPVPTLSPCHPCLRQPTQSWMEGCQLGSDLVIQDADLSLSSSCKARTQNQALHSQGVYTPNMQNMHAPDTRKQQ